MSSSSSSSSGIGFYGGLALLFIALKLLDKIDWSWWWVLAPLWMPITLILCGLLIFGLVLGLVALITWMVNK